MVKLSVNNVEWLKTTQHSVACYLKNKSIKNNWNNILLLFKKSKSTHFNLFSPDRHALEIIIVLKR